MSGAGRRRLGEHPRRGNAGVERGADQRGDRERRPAAEHHRPGDVGEAPARASRSRTTPVKISRNGAAAAIRYADTSHWPLPCVAYQAVMRRVRPAGRRGLVHGETGDERRRSRRRRTAGRAVRGVDMRVVLRGREARAGLEMPPNVGSGEPRPRPPRDGSSPRDIHRAMDARAAGSVPSVCAMNRLRHLGLDVFLVLLAGVEVASVLAGSGAAPPAAAALSALSALVFLGRRWQPLAASITAFAALTLSVVADAAVDDRAVLRHPRHLRPRRRRQPRARGRRRLGGRRRHARLRLLGRPARRRRR